MAKDPQQSLRDWSAQKWMTSGTYANKKKGSSKEVKSKGKKRYLPEAAWGSLSAGEKAATNKAKAKGKVGGTSKAPKTAVPKKMK